MFSKDLDFSIVLSENCCELNFTKKPIFLKHKNHPVLSHFEAHVVCQLCHSRDVFFQKTKESFYANASFPGIFFPNVWSVCFCQS